MALLDPATVLVFDLDDTLYPECEYVRSGFLAAGSWLESEFKVPQFAAVATELFEQGHRGNVFDLALSKMGVPEARKLVPQLLQVYRAHKPVLSLYSDARNVLRDFSSVCRLGIITDGYAAVQRNKVAALRLEPMVDKIIYSDDYGREHWKPSPTPYLKLIEGLGCDHHNCVYVADNPVKDFIAPRALGWRTIQVVRPQGEYSSKEVLPGHEAHHSIRSLRELSNVLKEIR